MPVLYALKSGAKISTKHMAPCQELINRAVDRWARYGKSAAPRTKDRHPDDPPLGVNQRPALGSWAERQVKTNEGVDSTPANTLPSSAREGDHAECGERCALMTSDGKNHVTRAKRGSCGRCWR